MQYIHNGMPAADLGPADWSKPWSSTNGGACVEAKKLPSGQIAIRQSDDPESPALIFELHEIRAFIEGARTGLADYLLS
jgi:hypothetical protein